MPSENKTDVLKLNQYIGTDKPSFLDYNKDMEKIDELAKNHNLNTDRIGALEDRSIKNPQYVPNGTDFNTLTEVGWYCQDTTVETFNDKNIPNKVAFIMQVVKINSGEILQRFSNLFGTEYLRYYYDGNWGKWNCLNREIHRGAMYKYTPKVDTCLFDENTNYFHINTGISAGAQSMGRVKLKGYSYRTGTPLDMTIVWYEYFSNKAIINCSYTGATMRSLKVGSMPCGQIGIEISAGTIGLYFEFIEVAEVWSTQDCFDPSKLSINTGGTNFNVYTDAIHRT